VTEPIIRVSGPRCCLVGCEEAAEYEIIDKADPRPDAAFTQACEAHVGALLGHLPDLPDDAANEWTVVSL
jgi:hypothetical protein